MTLTAGSRLGPYEVLSPLGAGGMGEVYRARDTRLGREVAIKVLPAAVSADPSRLKRFEKEARSASALNHPSIVTIHDVGESGGTSFIAMELVDGQTLREILADGALPMKRLLSIAAPVADGLAKAHAAGIVHRDLKPENVMVTGDGFVKILDFGLAKLTQPEETSGVTEAPTVSGGTEPGLVMGTVGYMSPEQAAGRPLDFRSDQFSFGSILYEMATGKRAFARATVPETLSAIIRDEPEPIPVVNPQIPDPVSWVVERCLAKEPKQRYASTEDLARDLRTLGDRLGSASSYRKTLLPFPPKARRRRWPALLAILALLTAVAAASFLLGKREGGARQPSFHRLTFQRGYVWSARFSPDGQSILYGASWGGNPVQIFSTRPENPESLRLQIPSADILAVSSSGEMAILLGRHFVENWLSIGRLARMPISASAPREVFDDVEEADWSPDGSSLAVIRDVGGKNRLEFPAGRVLCETAGWMSDPRVSPKGDLVAFFDHPVRGDDAGSLSLVDRNGKKRELSGGWATVQGLAWAGNEIWFAGSKSLAIRDLYAVTTSGKIRTVAQIGSNLRIHDVFRDGRVLLTRDPVRAGIIAFLPGDKTERDMSWLDASWITDLSADGTSLLFSDGGATRPGVYMRRADGSPAVRLGDGWATGLSPDGRWAIANVPGHTEPVLLPTGPGELVSLKIAPLTEWVWANFLPDGKRLLIAGSEPGHRVRLYLLEPGGKPHPISEEGISLLFFFGVAVSPSGRAAAAIGLDQEAASYPIEGGKPEPLPGLAKGDVPLQWSEDGRTLYVYQRGEVPARVFRYDMASHQKEPWKELAPSDRAGVNIIVPIRITPDGRFYAYSYGQILSELDLVEGLR